MHFFPAQQNQAGFTEFNIPWFQGTPTLARLKAASTELVLLL